MGLSILMTTASTMTAIFATPMLTKLLAGALVPVNAYALFQSTLQVCALGLGAAALRGNCVEVEGGEGRGLPRCRGNSMEGWPSPPGHGAAPRTAP